LRWLLAFAAVLLLAGCGAGTPEQVGVASSTFVPVEEEDSPFVGFLSVEPAD
jgi:hypothetical protein